MPADSGEPERSQMSQSRSALTETGTGTAELTESDRHLLLAVERRRVVLDVLGDRTAPVYLDDLAVAVAERETDELVATNESVERMAVSLHHTHLPMLDDFGVIDYDPEATRVESGP